jgi:probable F420-dependent oxidoreductase
MPLKIDRCLWGSLSSIVGEVTQAAAQGFDGVGVGEIDGDPFLRLGAVASIPELTFFTSTLVAFGRTPMSTAAASYELSAATNGRFVLGLSSQVRSHLRNRYSVQGDRLIGRTSDYIDTLRAIWAAWSFGREADHRGPFYRFTLMTPFFAPKFRVSPPKIALGAVGPSMARLAGRKSDAVVSHAVVAGSYFEGAYLAAFRQGVAERVDGVSPEIWAGTILVTPALSGDESAHLSEARRMLAFFFATPSYRSVILGSGVEPDLIDSVSHHVLRGRFEEAERRLPDSVLSLFVLFGSSKTIAKSIEQRYVHNGVSRLGVSLVGNMRNDVLERIRHIVDERVKLT